MTHLLRRVAVVAMLAVPASALAQDAGGGVRVGLNLADLSFSTEPPPPAESEMRKGLVVGAFGVVPLVPHLAFQPEVLYSQQGTQFSGEGMTVRLEFDYVQVPLLLAIRPAGKVSVIAGPSLGFRTRAHFEGTGGDDEFDEDLEDDVNRFDVGLVAGAAVDVGRFVIDGRYTWGLLNLGKDSSSESAKNRVITLSAGLRF